MHLIGAHYPNKALAFLNIPVRPPISYNTYFRAGDSSHARRGAGVAERG